MSTQIICNACVMNTFLCSFIGTWKCDRAAIQKHFARRRRTRRIEDFRILRSNYKRDVQKLRNKYGPEFDAIVREISDLDRVCEM